jgi:hypothetical protein
MRGAAGRLLARLRQPAPQALRAIGLALLLSLAGCAWLVEKQHELALRPTPGHPTDFKGLRDGDARWLVPVDGGGNGTQQLSLWWLPNADPAAPALLYLHGTFRSLSYNLPKIEALRDAGFSVLAVDYRGWGDSTPIIPSEATIVADAWRAWDELARRQPDPRRRVIYGHSMGGTIAVRLASELAYGRDYGALAIESTFTRVPDVAAAAGFWGRVGAALTTMEFDARSRIGEVDAPVWILHGTKDRTVPVDLGRQLHAAARPGARWVEFPDGSHSRLHSEFPQQYRQTFIELIGQLPPAGGGR